ncbi:hypothetical protein CJ178_06310 [Rhodococcus sp. ACPA4]|jgi:hypothetical protein|uniref:Dihydroorotate dehydrogenase n=3 Tax=Nocardiaceae TaxID=85025 RepID=A0A652YNC1_NOCGL|nr:MULTISPECIES: DUF5703 family protein [Rhodococcus]NMD62511.1 hypothetical protein [Nocardia globerula]NRI64778.1 hypothetical protein [Rhodococcus sp. MS16]PBC41259.1 hypothetical protein CJ178_06310 [Rhodococcus sp. ACPA4]PSR40545.1 hypothetical protein C7T36_23750 [Rhodococcus sp. AD45-ID]RZL25333.1 MAG: hypothetical protein EOP31_09490 [Rhodococcus sp. (in: high G+C Gram-positive bacteria)]
MQRHNGGSPHLRRTPSPQWDMSDDVFDYLPLQLPPHVSRVTASMRLAISAEFGGWELSQVRLYPDGSRRVLLRRKKTPLHVDNPDGIAH